MNPLHPPIEVSGRSESGGRIAAALDDGRPITGTIFRPFIKQSVATGSLPAVLGATIVNYPHILELFTYQSAIALNIGLSMDLLISRDVSTDVNAALRDRHLSGVTALTGGFGPHPNAQYAQVKRRVEEWRTVYKFLVSNSSGAAQLVYASVQIIPLCAR